jgi:hypothetical protein
MTYDVDLLKTRFWSATLPPGRLAEALNRRAEGGWEFRFSITAERRILLIFKRPMYLLIFQK